MLMEGIEALDRLKCSLTTVDGLWYGMAKVFWWSVYLGHAHKVHGSRDMGTGDGVGISAHIWKWWKWLFDQPFNRMCNSGGE